MHLPRFGPLALVATLAPGCIFTPPSRGELGKVELAYHEGLFGCIFGCDASAPVAERAHTLMLVLNDDDIPPFYVQSEAPTVMTFTQDEPGVNPIHVQSFAPGQTRLIFQDESGELIDRFPMGSHAVARIAPRDDDEYIDTYTIMVGGEDVIGFSLFDENEQGLAGFGGVDYAVSGGITEDVEVTLGTALGDAIASLFAGVNDEYVRIDARSVGTGQIVVTAASGATLDIPVAIVDETAVTRVLVEDDDAIDYDLSRSAFAHAWVGDEVVHDPACVWSISPADGPVQITSEHRDFVTVGSDVPGEATVTCTIGGVSASDVIRVVHVEG